MKVAALLSGGKDSVSSIHVAKSKGWEIKKNIIMKPENKDSWMYHRPNPEIPETQSKLMNIPYTTVKTKGEKEEELKPLKKALKELKEKEEIEGFISGAIKSEYQKTRLEKIGKEVGLKSICPLWKKDPDEIMEKQSKKEYRTIITKISSGALDKTWLGREINEETLKELKELREKMKINITGEGGEYETTVLKAPLFNGEIIVKKGKKKIETPNRGIYRLKEIETRKKKT